MPNKTIYVSKEDEKIFEEAAKISGDAISSIIAKTLREYVSMQRLKTTGFSEVKINVGSYDSAREQRFIGKEIGKWQGFSDNKEWWLQAKVYKTQKNNFAVYLRTICKGDLVRSPLTGWMKGDNLLVNYQRSDLIIGKDIADLEGKIPSELLSKIKELDKKDEEPSEFLDI